MRNKTRVGLVALALAAAAAPAFADSVTVNATTTLSSRQLKVLDMAGQPLTSISLTPGRGMPFQVQVVDSGFSNLSAGHGYSVTATMNNLYKVTAANSWDFNTAIPSKDLSVDYQTNPIRAFNPVASVLGNITVGGTLPVCTVGGTVGSIAGLPNVITDIIASNPLTGTALATQLCNELTSAVSVTTSSLPLQAPTSVNLSSLLPTDLPVQLPTTGETGAFTNADYSSGTIGSGDGHAPSGWATDVTGRKLLTGSNGLSANLLSLLNTTLAGAVGNLPLTSADGTGALLPVSSVISAINSLGGSFSTLAGTLTQIPVADAVQLLNTLEKTLNTPVLGDLSNVGQTSVSLPVLNYSGATTVPTGNYQGTMTVTLLSQ